VKLGDRAIGGGVSILVLGSLYVLLSTRQQTFREIKEAQHREDVKWEGGIAYLKPRPGIRRRLA
jgi:hypothetical protein